MSDEQPSTPAQHKPRSSQLRMRDSRKFRALLLAIVVYAIPILMTFALCLKGKAAFSDLFETMKWMAGALSPAFLAYIGGVAWEKTKTS